jgi:acetylornithine deacetylase
VKSEDVKAIKEAVAQKKDQAIKLLQDLIRIPSENHPPIGDEKQVQEFYFDYLKSIGLESKLFEVDNVPGFKEHPGRLKDHDMKDRPNVVGISKGNGKGKSIILAAHADTELAGGKELWTDGDPFSGAVRGGKICGRGAGDDKSGMAIAAMVPQVLKQAGVQLRGDLTIASVSDEEQGGAGGTVGLLAAGYKADVFVFLDGLNNDLWISNLGGGFCYIDITIPTTQWDSTKLLEYFDEFRRRIADFRSIRKAEFKSHRHYENYCDAIISPVSLSNILLGTESVSNGQFTVTFYLLPGEEPEDFKKRVAKYFFGLKCSGSYKMRWMSRLLPASELDPECPIINCFENAFVLATERKLRKTGSCISDMGIINKYGSFPCLLFGPGRPFGQTGSPHQPDEFIYITDFMECLETVVFTVMEWCGFRNTNKT